MIDTGAQRTCLSRSVIGRERLIHHGKRPIQNVHGIERHYVYLVNLGLFCERVDSAVQREGDKTYYSLGPLEVIDIADNYSFDAILGMDVIERIGFSISPDREFLLQLD